MPMMNSWFGRAALMAAVLVGVAGGDQSASAGPIVSYSATGSAGDWTLDFSVTNSLGTPGQGIYFFGVLLDARDIVGSPAGWDPDGWPTWDNSSYGGSSTVYNNNWIDFSITGSTTIGDGETLSGFKAHTTAVDLPVSVAYFVFSFGDVPYLGGDSFNIDTNPGFEGIATLGVVPEPSTLAMTGIAGLLLVRAVRRRRRV